VKIIGEEYQQGGKHYMFFVGDPEISMLKLGTAGQVNTNKGERINISKELKIKYFNSFPFVATWSIPKFGRI
jgi:hypothetical protein